MGNLLSQPWPIAKKTVFNVILPIKHKHRAIVCVCCIGLAYSIWKRRAIPHPNIPMNEASSTFYFGDLFRNINNSKSNDPGKQYYESVVVPTLAKMKGKHYLFCESNPAIPGLPIPRYGVILFHPQLVKIIFTDKFESFQKTQFVHDPLEELFGDGIFTADPPQWRWHRKFTMRNLKDHIFGCGVRNARILIDKMAQYKNNVIYKMADLVGRFTLQSFVESAFGQHLEIIESAPTKHPFNAAFDNIWHLLMMRYGDPFWKIKRKFKIGRRESVEIPGNIAILNDFVYGVINSRRKNQPLFTDETGDENKKYDLLSLFLRHKETLIDPDSQLKELRDITMNFVIAARDTTKVLISWFLYEISLGKNRHILSKLVGEIDDNYFGDNIEGNNLSPSQLKLLLYDLMADIFTADIVNVIVSYFGSYSCDDINEIQYDDKFANGYKYLTATLLETLRYRPSVAWLARVAVKDEIVEFDGNVYTICKGSSVAVSCYSYSRMKHIFGDDADTFNPDRFAEKGINTFNMYQYPYFNVKPRFCLGRNVAIAQAKIVAILILRNFVIEPIRDQNVTTVFSPLTFMKHGFKIKLK